MQAVLFGIPFVRDWDKLSEHWNGICLLGPGAAAGEMEA
jgi:hypothetical protein